MSEGYDIKEFVEAYTGHPEVLREILSIFKDETPQKLATLESAIAEGDLQTVDRTAHSLANTVGTLRARAAVESARATQSAARSGDSDAASVSSEVLAKHVAEILRQIGELESRS